jgi:hypothetical protein
MPLFGGIMKFRGNKLSIEYIGHLIIAISASAIGRYCFFSIDGETWDEKQNLITKLNGCFQQESHQSTPYLLILYALDSTFQPLQRGWRYL